MITGDYKNFKKNIKGLRVFIWGLGLNRGGLEATKFFARNGAEVSVLDLKSKKDLEETLRELKDFKIKYILGRQNEKDFEGAELIIKNPAIPWDCELAKKLIRKYRLETDVTLFFRLFKGKKVGVTGSKGKTTTTTLLAQTLKSAGKKIIVGGNLRVSLFSFFNPRILNDKNIVAVLEMSSFQLEDLEKIKKSPNLSIVTNILRDHLNRYGTYRKYIDAKLNICRFQTAKDLLVLNIEDKKADLFFKASKARKAYFSSSAPGKNSYPLYYSRNKTIGRSLKNKCVTLFSIENKVLLNPINLKNACAVSAGLAEFFKLSPRTMGKSFNRFKGVPYRMEKVRRIKGVDFINDTTATIPDASLASIQDFEQGLILIAGGADKNLKFARWAETVGRKVKLLILIEGTGTEKIKSVLKRKKIKLDFFEVKNMDKAVKLAYKKAVKGDTVLLSPGCASFGVFKNEFDRGDQFNRAVKNLQ